MGSGSVSMTELKIDLTGQIKEIRIATAVETRDDIRNGSPRRNGVYEQGWTHSEYDEFVVVHNVGKEKSLTHLLENGHATKNGGFVAPREHIRPAYLRNKEKYLNKLKSIKIKPE